MPLGISEDAQYEEFVSKAAACRGSSDAGHRRRVGDAQRKSSSSNGKDRLREIMRQHYREPAKQICPAALEADLGRLPRRRSEH